MAKLFASTLVCLLLALVAAHGLHSSKDHKAVAHHQHKREKIHCEVKDSTTKNSKSSHPYHQLRHECAPYASWGGAEIGGAAARTAIEATNQPGGYLDGIGQSNVNRGGSGIPTNPYHDPQDSCEICTMVLSEVLKVYRVTGHAGQIGVEIQVFCKGLQGDKVQTCLNDLGSMEGKIKQAMTQDNSIDSKSLCKHIGKCHPNVPSNIAHFNPGPQVVPSVCPRPNDEPDSESFRQNFIAPPPCGPPPLDNEPPPIDGSGAVQQEYPMECEGFRKSGRGHCRNESPSQQCGGKKLDSHGCPDFKAKETSNHCGRARKYAEYDWNMCDEPEPESCAGD